jgi:hypothetical protein
MFGYYVFVDYMFGCYMFGCYTFGLLRIGAFCVEGSRVWSLEAVGASPNGDAP